MTTPAASLTAPSDAILARLMALHPKIIDLTLERTLRLLSALGDPHRALPPVVHVAGTNGKGSTIAFMRAALESAGRAVHVYTSPHLVRFHERIRLGRRDGPGALIAEPALAALLDECEQANGGAPITFFEITTCAAFLAFARTPADVLLLEVGLGGRLDSTNVIERPAVSVITPVDHDHHQYLGDTLEAIAAEKAGILKPGAPAVVAPQNDAVMAAIAARALSVGAPLFAAGVDWLHWEERGRLVYQEENALLDLPAPRLSGRHQFDNAAVAAAALRRLGVEVPALRLDNAAIAAGVTAAAWPGRLQRLSKGPLFASAASDAELWLDGGHNPSAGRALAAMMSDLALRAPRTLTLIVGMLNTKDPRGFFAPFTDLARQVIAVRIPEEANAAPAADLADAARAVGLNAATADSVAAAVAMVEPDRIGPRILICGSLYLAGQVLRDNE